MQIVYVFYLTLVARLFAVTMPESQGRWFALCKAVVFLVSYAHSTTSAGSLPYHFVIVTNSVSTENSFSSTGGVDVCWLSLFGLHGTCHPLDIPFAPTPTITLDTPGTRTVSAITASPISLKLVLYKDMFAVQFETTKALKISKEYKSTQGGIPGGAKPANPLDLLTTAVSTMIIVQLLTIFCQYVVGYLESSNRVVSIPNNLKFYPLAVFPDGRHPLTLSWASTTSSLIPIDWIAYVPSNDEASLEEFTQWIFYFATVLVRSCPELPTTETRARVQYPLMIEAPASGEATEEVLSFCWFQSHTPLASSSTLDEGSEVKPTELKDTLDFSPPVPELKSAVQSWAPDVVHPPAPPTTCSVHFADYIDEPRLEITDRNQLNDLAPTRSQEILPTVKGLPRPYASPGAYRTALVRSFERISGQRTTSPIQLEHGQVNGASNSRPSLSLAKVISMESRSLGEHDFSLLSQFPAPPKKVPTRPFSLLARVGMGRGSFFMPPLSPTPETDSQDVRRRRLLRMPGFYNSSQKNYRSTVDLVRPARKVKRGSSVHYRPASQSSPTPPSVVIGPDDLVPGPPPQLYTDTTSEEGSTIPDVHLLIPSPSSKWSLLTKKSRQKLKKVSSSLFASSDSFSNPHEKVNVFPKSFSRRALGMGKRPAGPLDPLFRNNKHA